VSQFLANYTNNAGFITSSTGWANNQILFGTNNFYASSSALLTFSTSTGVLTVGSSSLTNISSTNLTASGYVQVQNLFDAGGTKYVTSTSGGDVAQLVTSTALGTLAANQLTFFYPGLSSVAGTSTITISTTTGL